MTGPTLRPSAATMGGCAPNPSGMTSERVHSPLTSVRAEGDHLRPIPIPSSERHQARTLRSTMSRLPRTLGEAVAGHGECLIPFTHDRFNEAHYWWHEMARNYHEPDPFRYSLGAFIQAARSVTFMLQSEKAAFADFEWYDMWRQEAKASPELSWITEARTDVVHRSALLPGSWIDFRCIRDPGDPLYGNGEANEMQFHANPFICTHVIFGASDRVISSEDENHDHELERHWEIDRFPEIELLDLSATVYAQVSRVHNLAHSKVGGDLAKTGYEGDTPPCMHDTTEWRIARFERRKGKIVWKNEPKGLHVMLESD